MLLMGAHARRKRVVVAISVIPARMVLVFRLSKRCIPNQKRGMKRRSGVQ